MANKKYNPSKQGGFACVKATGQLKYQSVKQLLKDNPNAQEIMRWWLDRDKQCKKSTYKVRDTIVALKYLIFSDAESYSRCIIQNKLTDQWSAAIKRPFRVTSDVELTSLLAIKCQVRRDTFYRRVKKYVASTKRKEPLQGASYMRAYDRLIDEDVDFTPGLIDREVNPGNSHESIGKFRNLACPVIRSEHGDIEEPQHGSRKGLVLYGHEDLSTSRNDDARDIATIGQLLSEGADIFDIHSALGLSISYRELTKRLTNAGLPPPR